MKFIEPFIQNKKNVLFVLGIIGVFLNIILFSSTNSLLLLILMAYWFILGIKYKLDEKYYFGIALVLLVLSVIPFLLGRVNISERFSVWQFLFLILGLVQWLLSEVKFLRLFKK